MLLLSLTHTQGRLLNSLEIQDTVTGEKSALAVNGLFYAIGHKPNTAFLKTTGLKMDSSEYLVTVPNDGVPSTYTNIPGVFACGDVQDKTYRQAVSIPFCRPPLNLFFLLQVTAAGSGCMAALDCERWLEAQGDSK